jgi:hypothetical protein
MSEQPLVRAHRQPIDRLCLRAGSLQPILDSLLHEFKNDLVRIWIPIAAGGAQISGPLVILVEAKSPSHSARIPDQFQ